METVNLLLSLVEGEAKPALADANGGNILKNVILGALGASVALTMAAPASAGPLRATSAPMIVGQTSTATLVGGGDPRYFANASRYNGVVSLIMETSGGSFICSGSLLGDRRSIVTAAHCVSGGNGTPTPIKTTAYFYGGIDPDVVPSSSQLATGVTVASYFVNSGYTGQVVDDNDIAVLRLSDLAPSFAKSYGLFTDDLTGQDFNVAGFGRRSDTGGSIGSNLNPGRRRQGDNKFDYAIGDAAFNGQFESAFGGTASKSNIMLADFDNGTASQDSGCRIAIALGAGNGFCDTGRGAMEVMIAGGDSGGPSFVNGRIATVTSFISSFGMNFGDVDNALNNSWGELGGFVPVSIHETFIRRSMVGGTVPEPATWAMMMIGVGAVGGSLRRRRRTTVTFA